MRTGPSGSGSVIQTMEGSVTAVGAGMLLKTKDATVQGATIGAPTPFRSWLVTGANGDASFRFAQKNGATERSGEIKIPRSGVSDRCAKRKRGPLGRAGFCYGALVADCSLSLLSLRVPDRPAPAGSAVLALPVCRCVAACGIVSVRFARRESAYG